MRVETDSMIPSSQNLRGKMNNVSLTYELITSFVQAFQNELVKGHNIVQ